MLTLNPGDIFAENYRLIRLIDTGGFSEVWEAEFLSAGNIVALKIYPKLDVEGVKNIEAEYKNQSDLSHTNLLIARYFGKYSGYPFLEMRYCGGGNASGKIGEMPEAQIAKCIFQIASALEYLHANNIVHQDVKPNNFLLDNSGNYNLCDLGLSLKVRTTIMKFTQAKGGGSNSIAGATPPAYRAPELYDRSSIGAQPVKATDIWALGASVYELATGEMPFGEFGGLMQLKNMDDIPDLPKQYSAGLNSIIKKCLSKETWDRPKASELSTWTNNYLHKGEYGFTVVKEGGKTVVPEPDIRKKRGGPVFIILLVLVIAAGAVWGITTFINRKDDSGKVINGDAKADSAKKILITDSVKVSNIITDTGTTKKLPIVLNTSNGNKKEPKAEKEKTAAEPESITKDYPNVSTPPIGDCPPIIKRTIIKKSNFVVIFHMRNCMNNMSLYPPGNNMAFYVRTTDKSKTFNLVSISTSGSGISIPSSGLDVTATFERLDDGITAIDIIEGKIKSIDPGVTFFNFKNVIIK